MPIAVSAFDSAMIEDRQIVGLSDLQMNVPNVTFAPRQASFSGHFPLRGIGLQPASGSSESPSSMHVNEIPFPRLYAGVDFYDLERIELMRGPQGTLFGRNATAGALNLVTRRPSFDRVSGYADLEFGDYDHRQLKGALNVPVITFESARNQWVTRFWIRNATDEEKVIARSNRQQVIYGEPRVYGVSVRYNLGDDRS